MQSQASVSEIYSENYRFLQQHVYSQAGIVLEDDKHYCSKAASRRSSGNLASALSTTCALSSRPRAKTEVGRQVVEAMTTNETYFFRDPPIMRPSGLSAAPVEGRPAGYEEVAVLVGRGIDWQEAYSLAMLLLQENFVDWNIEILGTDFSSQVLERARSGKYQQIEVNRGLPAALLVKHFRRSGVEWQLSEPVRRMARFETMTCVRACALSAFRPGVLPQRHDLLRH